MNSSQLSVATLHKKSALDIAALTVSGFCTLCILGWLLWFVRFGIDFADEGFYLNWISNPLKFKASSTHFGFIYYPLYNLLAGDISAIRQANVLITFFLSWGLTYVSLGTIHGSSRIDLPGKLIASAGVSVAFVFFYRNWLPTPNYNFLAFQSLMLVATGLLVARKSCDMLSLLGWFLIGFGGWLAFMSKPTSAAAVALLVLVYLYYAKKLDLVGLAIAGSIPVVALVSFALMIDGSLASFAQRMEEGVRLAHVTAPTYGLNTLLRIDQFSLTEVEWGTLFLVAAVLAVLLRLSVATTRTMLCGWLPLYIVAAALMCWLIWGVGHTVLDNRLWVHLISLSIPLGALAAGVSIAGGWYAIRDRMRSQWPILGAFLVMPWVFAFGTGGNYWFYYGLSSIFWVLAGLFFVLPVDRPGAPYPLLSYAIAIQVVAPLVVLVAIEDPYYQPLPLREATYKVKFGSTNSSLSIAPSFGLYLDQAQKVAVEGGLTPGTPMIDLTGRSPGLLYGIGAGSTGSPWIYGNYINSNQKADELATEVLKGVACEELSQAWVLLEPEGPVSISPSVLRHFGMDVVADYQVVGSVQTVPSLGGFPVVKDQWILKPVRSAQDAAKHCLSLKDQ